MARLGDGFPADKRRAFVERRLVPGCVVRIVVKFPETTKAKFLVLVADDDPEYCLFIVNSNIQLTLILRHSPIRNGASKPAEVPS